MWQRGGGETDSSLVCLFVCLLVFLFVYLLACLGNAGRRSTELQYFYYLFTYKLQRL
jgi:hypothetical protein